LRQSRLKGGIQVLELARELKLLKLGIVSLDGILIRANASKDKNISYQRAQQLRTQLQQEVNALLQQAEQADQADEDPQKLPEEIARRQALLKKMDEACARLEARAKARAEAERAECRRQLGQRQAREGNVQSTDFKPPPGRPAPEDQINLTDPDARLMRKSQREGYSQSYNAQVVVDAEGSQLIVGQRVSDCASNAGQLVPDLQRIPKELCWPTAGMQTSRTLNGCSRSDRSWSCM
jgi:DNA repair exonuclease SbcCD ATPase subunit